MNTRNIGFESNEVIAAIFFDKNARFDIDHNGTRVTYTGVEEFYQRTSLATALYPVSNDLINFVSVRLPSSEPLLEIPLELKPTVILHNGASLLCVFALEDKISSTNPYIADLGKRFGINPTDPIPLPGDEWTLVLPDQYRQYSLEDLVAGLFPENGDSAEAASETFPKHFDADVITPYDPSHYPKSITITEGRNKESRYWTPKIRPLTAFIDDLCQHQIGPKDGRAFVLGDLAKGQRLKTAVKTCTAVGLDIDVGTPRKVIDNALAKLGCLAVNYSTHSNGKKESEFRKDAVVAFAPDEEITSDLMQRFVRENQQWDDSVAKTVELERIEHIDRGIMVFISHDPMPKHRIVIPLSEPFVIADEGTSQKIAWDKWATIPTALAAVLGLPLDKSCTDPARLFYHPRHDKGAPFNVSLFGGPLLDHSTLTNSSDPLERLAEVIGKGGKKSVTPSGQALGKWASQTADGFEILSVLEDHCPEKIRGSATSGKTIDCPFDDDHHNPGDQNDSGCLAVDARDSISGLFVVSCRHESCRQYTNLDMLGRMIDQNWFEHSVIDDPQYDAVDRSTKSGQSGGSPSSDKSTTARSSGGASPSGSSTASKKVHFDSRKELIDELNKHCGLVKIGSQTRYIVEDDDGIDFLTKQAASDWFAPWKLVTTNKDGDPKLNSGFSAWVNSHDRRVYSKVVFEPNRACRANHYNLWKGLAVKPVKGDWSLMLAHIYDVICAGDYEHFLWLISWLAQMIQVPGEKCDTAVAIRSGKGTGKSIFANWFTEIFGDHAITMSRASQFVGRFNAHYERAILAVAEESFWAGDKEADGALKHLISGKTHRIERKGVDSIEVPNYTRVLILGNNEWVVPASEDERRYFVLEVDESRKQKPEYFGPLVAQAKSGGVAAMLYDLQRFDYSTVDLRNPPKTPALLKQLYEGMDQERRWWHEVLENGEFIDAQGETTDWPLETTFLVKRTVVFDSYKCAVAKFAGRPPSMPRMGKFLARCLPGHSLDAPRLPESEGRQRQYLLPSLRAARKLNLERTGLAMEASQGALPTTVEAGLAAFVRNIERETAMSMFDEDRELRVEDFLEPGQIYEQ